MEMRWEKLYSGGLGEFHQSKRAICRSAQRSTRRTGLWVCAMIGMVVIGSVLVFL